MHSNSLLFRAKTRLALPFQAAFLEGSEHAVFYFRLPDHVDSLFTDLPESERREKLRIYEVRMQRLQFMSVIQKQLARLLALIVGTAGCLANP